MRIGWDCTSELLSPICFPFFRATFYRWLQVWPETCTELDRVPHILSVGDLRVENFGTWRDTDGRLAAGDPEGLVRTKRELAAGRGAGDGGRDGERLARVEGALAELDSRSASWSESR